MPVKGKAPSCCELCARPLRSVDAAAALLEAGANCAMLVAARPGEPPENLIDVARSKRDHAMLQLLVKNEEACDVGLEDMEGE